MDFNNLKTTQYGEQAENMFLNEFITSKGFVPYRPSIQQPHPVDAIAMSGNSTFYVEIKAKSRMLRYDNTGFDLADWELYKTFPHPTYILFADPASKKLYGQWTIKLEQQPSINFGEGNKEVITWPLSGMTSIRDLTENEVQILSNYENSSYR